MASHSERNSGQWSPWFNSDRPWIGTGDVETLKSIEHHFGPVCGFRETIEATQCQLTKYGQQFTDITAHTLRDELQIPCNNKGLLCQNNQQNSGICHDYAVRFLCTLSNDSDVRDQDGDYFPQFDARIYIILAVVPILVFILRVLWGFVFRRRRRQRRRRARRNGQRGGGGGDDDDDDSSSVASSLAHAPPSYHQLFGDLGSNRANMNRGGDSIFAITRNTLTVCQGCKETKCSVAKALCLVANGGGTNNGATHELTTNGSSLTTITTSHSTRNSNSNSNSSSSSVVIIPVSEDTQQHILQHSVRIEGGDGSTMSQSNTLCHQHTTQQEGAITSSSSSSTATDNTHVQQQPSTSLAVVTESEGSSSLYPNSTTTTSNTANPQTPDYSVSMQFEMDATEIPVFSTSSSTSTQIAASSNNCYSSELSMGLELSNTFLHPSSSSSLPSSSSLSSSSSSSNTTRGEEILLKATAANTPSVSNGISQPCPCACHRTVAITATRGRSISSSGGGFDNGGFHGEGVEGIVPAPLPEVPALQRVYSNLSNGSVITLSELPTYEDALDLIKKKEQMAAE